MISVIIPVFNSATFIEETLNSLMKQSYKDWECILIDDGSSDQTENIIEKYLNVDGRFNFHKRPSNLTKGPSACRNFGFSLSKGDYIHFMDSDDLYLPNALELCINRFDESHDAVVAPLEFIEDHSKRKIKKNIIVSDNLLEEYFTGKIAFYVSGPIWKKQFLKDKELFDPDLRNLDDWDFNLRMIYKDPKIFYLTEPLIQYRIRTDSLSSEISKMNYQELKSEFRAREKHLDLIIKKKLAHPRKLREFIIKRYKFVLRNALVSRDNHRFFFLKKLLIHQYKLKYLSGMLQSLSSFIFFLIFRKGYKYLNK